MLLTLSRPYLESSYVIRSRGPSEYRLSGASGESSGSNCQSPPSIHRRPPWVVVSAPLPSPSSSSSDGDMDSESSPLSAPTSSSVRRRFSLSNASRLGFDPGFQSKLAFHPNLKRFSRNIIHVHLQTPPRINQRRPSAFHRRIDCSGRIPLPEGNEKGIRELFQAIFFRFAHNVCPNAFQAVRSERDTQRCITNIKSEFYFLRLTIESCNISL